MPDRLTYRGGAIIGSVAGKLLHCIVRPARLGMTPPAGEYRVAPPTNDAIFGPVALLTPVNGGKTGGGVAGLFNATGGISAMNKQERPGGIASMTKQERPGGITETASLSSVPQGSAVFVLSTRPIAGRNCLIVTAGAELFEAVRAAGGAAITVS